MSLLPAPHRISNVFVQMRPRFPEILILPFDVGDKSYQEDQSGKRRSSGLKIPYQHPPLPAEGVRWGKSTVLLLGVPRLLLLLNAGDARPGAGTIDMGWR